MTRREHLQKAHDAYSQVIAHLQAAGAVDDLLETNIFFSEAESAIMDLMDAEPRGKDTDDAYEQMIEDEMGCM